MAGRLRFVDFSDFHADIKLKHFFPENTEIIKNALIQYLAYEKACPRKDNNRFYWEYEIKGKRIAVYFIMETPADPYSKIQVKSIEEIS